MRYSRLSESASKSGYQIVERLGEGGNGIVYKAIHNRTSQEVAVKILCYPQGGARQEYQKGFEREARLCAELRHPNIVRLLDKGHLTDEVKYAAFEYVPGDTLKEYLRKKGPLPPCEAHSIMLQILDGLVCAHARGIVHRDIKPQNIMISPMETGLLVKILDFGIADFDTSLNLSEKNTAASVNLALGTPAYSAPEQLKGLLPTVKTDLYAWGLLLIECLTGEPAIRGKNTAEIAFQQLSSDEVLLPYFLFDHPLAVLLRRVLKKDHQFRPGNTREIYEQFKKINLDDLKTFRTTTSGSGIDTAGVQAAEEKTIDINLYWQTQASEKLFITILCVSYFVESLLPEQFDPHERMTAEIQTLCTDVVSRFGGSCAESLPGIMLFYFGYPRSAETDSRMALLAAKEVSEQLAALQSRQKSLFRIINNLNLHVGWVNYRRGEKPGGPGVHETVFQNKLARPGRILLSQAAAEAMKPWANPKIVNDSAERNITLYEVDEFQPCTNTFKTALYPGWVFHGRRNELNQLKDAWEHSCPDDVVTIKVKGEMGIGKTALLSEFAGQLHHPKPSVKLFGCSPENQRNALSPFLDWLKKEWRIEKASEEERVQTIHREIIKHDLDPDTYLPVIYAWLVGPLPAWLDASRHPPERQKSILMEALVRIVSDTKCATGLILILDDAHWLDSDSASLVAKLAAARRNRNMMILYSYRYETDITRIIPAIQTLELARMDLSDSEKIIRNISGHEPISTESIQSIIMQSDGVPLFIEELTRLQLNQNLLYAHKTAAKRAPELSASRIPQSLRGVLFSRLQSLGAAKETAQIAAAIGDEFTLDLLRKISSKPDSCFKEDIRTLSEISLIQPHSDEKNRYAFRHRLMRDAAYESLSNDMKAAIHLQIHRQVKSRSPC